MEINFSNAEKVTYDNKEAIRVYVGDTKVWDVEHVILTSGYTTFKINFKDGHTNNEIQIRSIPNPFFYRDPTHYDKLLPIKKIYINDVEQTLTADNDGRYIFPINDNDIIKIEGNFGMFINSSYVSSVETISFADNLVSTNSMFFTLVATEPLDVSRLNTDKVVSMESMFASCWASNIIGVSNFNTEKVKYFYYMFGNCHVTTLDLYNWNVSSATTMNRMFYYCNYLTTLDGLSNWDVSNVLNFEEMFYNCKSLTTLDLSGWCLNPEHMLVKMSRMFYGCESLTMLNLSNINFGSISVEYSDMFYGIPSTCTIIIDPTKFINKYTGKTLTPQELGWTGTFTYV